MVLKSDSINFHQLLGECSKTKHLHCLGGALWFVVQDNPLQDNSLKKQLNLVLELLISVMLFQASVCKYRRNLRGENNE